MKNFKINSQILQIDSLLRVISSKEIDEFELSNWAKYICVLSSGLLENAIKWIFSEYAYSNTKKPIASFINVQLGRIRSPSCELFITIAAAFNQKAAEELKIELDSKGYGDAIDSIIRNRHLIVHGKARDCSVSFVQAKQYYENAKKGLDIIEEKFS